MKLCINKYNDINFIEWDNFILNKSLNGTLYHTRLFLSYHKDRFEDHSIMIYDNKKLIAVFPCCKINNEFHSHKGSTCGGIVILERYYTLVKLTEILNLIYDYYDNTLHICVSESTYFKRASNDLLVFLMRQKCESKVDISLYFDINREKNIIDNFPKSDNKRILKKYINRNIKEQITFKIADNDSEYITFYEKLSEYLKSRNKVSPLHTLEEFILLKGILKEKQFLLLAKNSNNELLSGAYVFLINKNTYYTVYLMTNYEKKYSQIFFTLYKLYQLAKLNNIKYVNLGACSKNGGEVILDTKYKMKYSCGCEPILKYCFTYKTSHPIYSSRLILKKMHRDEQFLIADLWQKNKYAQDMFFFENSSITYDSQLKWYNLKNIDSTIKLFSIYTKNDILIGYCGFKNITRAECELFIVILNKDYYNKGLGSECINTLIGIINSEKKIYLHVKKENLKSLYLYKKFNFEVVNEKDNIIKMERPIK